MNKSEIIINLVRELKVRGINVHLKFKEQTIQSRYITDDKLVELVCDNVVQSIYVETPHGKELIHTLFFLYSFEIDSLVITYKNGKVKIINLYS